LFISLIAVYSGCKVIILRIARVIQNSKETFAIIGHNGKVVTRDEISEQASLVLPPDAEDFLFFGYAKYVRDHALSKLSFCHETDEFCFLPPILKTFKIICLSFNYTDQGKWIRFGNHPPKDPVIYLKPRTSLIGPFDNILCPRFVNELDYEGELALVIGKKCKKTSEYDALDYVAGYFILNDISARDIQFVDKQYGRAKGFDTFGPCGPWITTVDEIPEPNSLLLTTKVNGEIRQMSSTENMVLKVNEIISKLSKVMTLEPGDIISTGTPSGTGLSMSSNSKYLKDNDTVEVEVEKLGKIKNKVLYVD
jgi:2-keto-4-pentenoate hydratase/2-oxohepta-3-ene-1,7-dioic acid hydratase in catechol pathway